MFANKRVVHNVTVILTKDFFELGYVVVLVRGDKIRHCQYFWIILVRFCFLRIKRVDPGLHQPTGTHEQNAR